MIFSYKYFNFIIFLYYIRIAHSKFRFAKFYNFIFFYIPVQGFDPQPYFIGSNITLHWNISLLLTVRCILSYVKAVKVYKYVESVPRVHF